LILTATYSKLVQETDLTGENFRVQASLMIAIVAIAGLLPFGINHLLQGRVFQTGISLAITGLLLYNAVLYTKGVRREQVNFLLLIPMVIAILGYGVMNQGFVVSLWSFPAIVAFYCVLNARNALIANLVLVIVVSITAYFSVPFELFTRLFTTLVATTLFTIIMVKAIDRQHEFLKHKVVTDHLTGVFNRTLLESTLVSAGDTAERSKKSMTVLSLDLDHFKNINDTFGHADGDAVLEAVGALMLKKVRSSDFVFRLGGEEFLILLSGSSGDNARTVAEALRADVKKMDILPDRVITISVGVAEYETGEHWSKWLARADKNLYTAKHDGRDRVVG